MTKYEKLKALVGIEKVRQIVAGAGIAEESHPKKIKAIWYVHEPWQGGEIGFYADIMTVGINKPHTHYKLEDLKTGLKQDLINEVGGLVNAEWLIGRLTDLGAADTEHFTILNGMWHKTTPGAGFTLPQLKEAVQP